MFTLPMIDKNKNKKYDKDNMIFSNNNKMYHPN